MTPRQRGQPPKIYPEINPEETIHINATLYGREWNKIRQVVIANHLTPSQVLRLIINACYIDRLLGPQGDEEK